MSDDDLVRQLRCYADIDDAVYNPWIYGEAADRIEKLETALREIAADFGTVSAVGTMDALYSAAAILAERISIARKALEGKDDVN